MARTAARQQHPENDVRAVPCPFPVAPEDVPLPIVRYIKRTLLRNTAHLPEGTDPFDDELARLIGAGVIALLSGPQAQPAPWRPRPVPAPRAQGMTALF